MVLKVLANPRFWGPCLNSEAADLVDDILNDSDTVETLRLFAIGEIESDEMAYRLQMGFESHDLRRAKNARESSRGPTEYDKSQEGA